MFSLFRLEKWQRFGIIFLVLNRKFYICCEFLLELGNKPIKIRFFLGKKTEFRPNKRHYRLSPEHTPLKSDGNTKCVALWLQCRNLIRKMFGRNVKIITHLQSQSVTSPTESVEQEHALRQQHSYFWSVRK